MSIGAEQQPAELELVIRRIFDAELHLVWQVWTDPSHLQKWICPSGFVVTHVEGDLRPNGRWLTRMRSPEGAEHVCGGEYREIEAPTRLVFTHAWRDETGEFGHETLVTVTLKEEKSGKTAMHFRQTGFSSLESRDGHEDGWSGAFDTVARHLRSLAPKGGSRSLVLATPSDREITMSRTFNAPRDLVWRAYAEPELIRQWMTGPEGHTMPICEMDFRVGGAWRYVWRLTDGHEMGAGGFYREIVPTERIVHTERFDEDWTGGETVVTTIFEETRGETIVTTSILYSSREARDAVLKSPMEEGLAQCFVNLDALLERSK